MRFMPLTTFILAFITVMLLISVASFSYQEESMSDDQLQDLFEKLETNFSKIETLKTKMKQEKNIPVFSDKVISHGYFLFKSPDKIRFDFTEPFKSSLIVDGRNIFKYEFFDGAWHKLAIKNKNIIFMVMENIVTWLKGSFKNTQLYEISVCQNESLIIKLIPKNDEFKKFITSFELGINSQLDGLDYIVITENKNSTARIDFYNKKQNEAILDAVFQGKENKPVPFLQW